MSRKISGAVTPAAPKVAFAKERRRIAPRDRDVDEALLVALAAGPGKARDRDGELRMGMRERAERLKGQLLLTSSPGKGTQVRLTVPKIEHNFSHE